MGAQSLVYYSLDDPDQNLMFLIIPGNPGVPFFMVPLMRELAKHYDRRYEVRCFSQSGCVANAASNKYDRAFLLKEQIQHKIYYVSKRLQANPRLRIVLIGHSVGCYLALQIAAKFPDAIEKMVLIQPAIAHLNATPSGVELSTLLKYRYLMVRFVKVIGYLFPSLLRRWFVSRNIAGDIGPVLQYACMSLMNTSVLKNVLYLGRQELEQIGKLDEELVRRHEDRMLFVYSSVDGWLPPDFVQKYQLRFPSARHHIMPQGHAFMMEKYGSHDMAAHIKMWLQDVDAAHRARTLVAEE